jgi:hypothetical protein
MFKKRGCLIASILQDQSRCNVPRFKKYANLDGFSTGVDKVAGGEKSAFVRLAKGAFYGRIGDEVFRRQTLGNPCFSDNISCCNRGLTGFILSYVLPVCEKLRKFCSDTVRILPDYFSRRRRKIFPENFKKKFPFNNSQGMFLPLFHAAVSVSF